MSLIQFYLVYRIDQISGLTTDEWIALKTTLEVMDNDKFQCIKCKTKYSDKQFEQVQRLMGCATPTGNHLVGSDRELKFTRCPGNFFSYPCLEVIESHGYFEKGMLPYSGGMFEQPNKIIEAYGIIAAYKYAKMEQEMRKQKQKAKQSVRGRPLGK